MTTKQDMMALEAKAGVALNADVVVLAKRGDKGYCILIDGRAATGVPELRTGREVELFLSGIAFERGGQP